MNDTAPTQLPPGGDAGRLDRAASIFLEIKALGLAEREEAVARACGPDRALRELVLLLLRGDEAPLPVESLADDVRAAGEAVTAAGLAEVRGSMIGRYRLIERLGEGGFGVVFAAEQTEPVRRRVALKLIKLGMDTRQVIARFQAERQALAMMDHPGIAKVFDAGATETGRPYFVMELVRGVPITEYCDARRLDIRARLGLFAQVCDALQHAHQKGVIHRDIKPSNILVTELGDTVIPKVIDFGIAKATGARLTERTVFTEMHQMIGTPEYMSPEQADTSALDVDTRSDVYSLGVLLYELLAGSTPFDGRRLRSAAYGEMQRIIREEDPPRPSTRFTGSAIRATVAAARGIEPVRLSTILRGELDWVVMRCLEKDRGRRYDSAGSLMRDVQRFLAGATVQAVPPSAGYRLRKSIRRHRAAFVAGSLLTLALVAGLVGTSVGFIRADRQRDRADQARQLAQSERDRADIKAGEALAAEARASRSAYSATMLSACEALSSNQLAIARDSLNAAPPALRGWEWRVLLSRLDTSTRAIRCALPGHNSREEGWEHRLIPHPDGRSFFTVRASAVEAAERWDLSSGELIARFRRPMEAAPTPLTPSRFVVSPSGERLVAYSGNHGRSPTCAVGVWDLSTNEPVLRRELALVEGITGSVALLPDGESVIRLSSDALVRQDVRTDRIVAEGPRVPVEGFIGLSPDGSRLALGDTRGTIAVVDARSLTTLVTLTGHRNMVHDQCFSADGRLLATASLDGTARVWPLDQPSPVPVVLEHPGAVVGVRFSPDALFVATSGRDRAIRVWDARTAQLRGVFTSDSLLVGPVMVMPDGRTVAGRERDGTVRFWDVTAESTANWTGHQGLLTGAAFADAVGLVVSIGWDGWRGHPGCVRLWDAETGEQVATLGEPGEVAYLLDISPDGSRAAVRISRTDSPWTPKEEISSSRVEIIDLHSGGRIRTASNRRPEPVGTAVGLAFDPSGARLALGYHGRVDVRHGRTGALLQSRELAGESRGAFNVTWSPDGNVLAFAPRSVDGAADGLRDGVVLLSAGTLEPIGTLNCGATLSISFSLDGSMIATGGADGMVRLFDVRTRELVRSVPAHDQGVYDIDFSPDGSRVATVGSDEGDIVVWNAVTWDRVARFHEKDSVPSARWNRDGTRLIGACGRTVRAWDATPLRERVLMRDRHRAALAEAGPRAEAILASAGSVDAALERLDRESSMTAEHRRGARQLLLRAGLQQPAVSAE